MSWSMTNRKWVTWEQTFIMSGSLTTSHHFTYIACEWQYPFLLPEDCIPLPIGSKWQFSTRQSHPLSLIPWPTASESFVYGQPHLISESSNQQEVCDIVPFIDRWPHLMMILIPSCDPQAVSEPLFGHPTSSHDQQDVSHSAPVFCQTVLSDLIPWVTEGESQHPFSTRQSHLHPMVNRKWVTLDFSSARSHHISSFDQ